MILHLLFSLHIFSGPKFSNAQFFLFRSDQIYLLRDVTLSEVMTLLCLLTISTLFDTFITINAIENYLIDLIIYLSVSSMLGCELHISK